MVAINQITIIRQIRITQQLISQLIVNPATQQMTGNHQLSIMMPNISQFIVESTAVDGAVVQPAIPNRLILQFLLV